MNNLFRMRELIELINDADKAYFGDDKPIISDKEYDALVEELTKIEKETGIHFKNSPIGKVGGEIKKGLEPVTHTKPMLSCNKTKDIREMVDFAKENEKFEIKSGFMDGKVLSLDEINTLAKTPSKETLIAKMMGSLNSPISGLARLLSTIAEGGVEIQDLIAKKAGEAVEEAAPVAEEAPAEAAEPVAEEAPAAEAAVEAPAEEVAADAAEETPAE